MIYLRQYIRQILLEKGELRKQWAAPGHPVAWGPSSNIEEDVDIKKWFHENADQASLQKLIYVHWGSPKEIASLLGGSGKNELNTSIHIPGQTLEPWDYDEQHHGGETVGLMVKGWVTFAGNVDLDSKRLGGYLKNLKKLDQTGYSAEMRNKWPRDPELAARAKKQHKMSGVPKRPSVKSMKERAKMGRIIAKLENVATNWFEIIEDEGYEWLEKHLPVEDAKLIYKAVEEEEFVPTHAEIPGKEIGEIEDLLILKAEDFVQRSRENLDTSIELSSLNWPEALIDNWKPVAIVAQGYDVLGDLAWEANDWEIPILDLDLNLMDEIYDEDFNSRCEDYQQDFYDDAPPEWEEACEEGDYTQIWPHLEKWA